MHRDGERPRLEPGIADLMAPVLEHEAQADGADLRVGVEMGEGGRHRIRVAKIRIRVEQQDRAAAGRGVGDGVGAGEAVVLGLRDQPDIGPRGRDPFGRAVARGVVDDDHLVGPVDPAGLQQGEAGVDVGARLVGDDEDAEGGGHRGAPEACAGRRGAKRGSDPRRGPRSCSGDGTRDRARCAAATAAIIPSAV